MVMSAPHLDVAGPRRPEAALAQLAARVIGDLRRLYESPLSVISYRWL